MQDGKVNCRKNREKSTRTENLLDNCQIELQLCLHFNKYLIICFWHGCYFKRRKYLTHFLKQKLPLSYVERAITYLVLNVVKEEKRTPLI